VTVLVAISVQRGVSHHHLAKATPPPVNGFASVDLLSVLEDRARRQSNFSASRSALVESV
jgi:hypothetical protein